MKLGHVLLVLVLSVAAAAGTSYVLALRGNMSAASTAHAETALERVLRTGVLRCGYYVFPPVTYRDPNTRALSGLSVDMMEAIGKAANLKIDWAEEIDFGTWMAGLKARRFDAICTPMWPEPSMAREALFTRSMCYSGINVYARADDHRFDNNIGAVNNPDVTIVLLEGNPETLIAQDVFPKAKTLVLPAMTPKGLIIESVVTNKADVFLWDESGIQDFVKANPGKIHSVDPAHPVKVMPFELMTNIGDSTLRDFLDVGLQSLEDRGITRLLLDKWERMPGNFYRMDKPYVVPVDQGGQ